MEKNQRLALVIAILASGIAFLDGSVINVALPAISDELGQGLTLKQWVVDSYLITLGALMLIAGSLSDLFGRKKILSLGLWGFAITSILCAIAPTGVFLIIARALQGVAGALLVPSSLALIIALFSGSKQGKAIGSWTAWTGIAFIIGPLLGGFLVDAGSWRLIFAINIIPIAITLWMVKKLKLVEKLDKKPSVDFMGAIYAAVALGGPVFALIEQPNFGWSSPVILLPIIIGIMSLAAFVWHENKTKHPMLPLEIFKIRNFLFGNLATVAIYGGLSVITFVLAVFVQQVGGYSALEAGMTLLPVTLVMFALSPTFGKLAGQHGPRLFMSLGPIVEAIGMYVIYLSVDSSAEFFAQILPGILIFSVGLAMTVAPLTTAVLSSIDAKRAGIGSATNNAIARIAGLVTIATLGFIAGSEIDLDGFKKSIIYLVILLIIGGVISYIGIRNPTASTKTTVKS